MKCFYHSADLDGHCSGAIVKDFHQECEMIGINYGQEFPWESIQPGEKVYVVDFSLQPFEEMTRLDLLCDLIWIDHHKSVIEEANRRKFETGGIRVIGIGACELVWNYLRPQAREPDAVRMLSEYDVWDHSDPRTLPFQYGFRLFEDTRPDNQELWQEFLKSDAKVPEVVKIGKTIMEYEKSQNKKFCRAYTFETELALPPAGNSNVGQVYRAVCCNRGFTNSKLFDSVWDPEKYDLMITFCRLKLPQKLWTVSLYSTRPDIDCGQIARIFDGGGHKGAAGFQCEQLPFEH